MKLYSLMLVYSEQSTTASWKPDKFPQKNIKNQ